MKSFLLNPVLPIVPYCFTHFISSWLDAGLEVRHVHIEARRTTSDSHHLIDLSAFNTDGFDVQGSHVWIHDCSIWNNDDCVSVKVPPPSLASIPVSPSPTPLASGSFPTEGLPTLLSSSSGQL